MSSNTGASEPSHLRVFFRALAALAVFAGFQLLAHHFVTQGESARPLLLLALVPQLAIYLGLLWFFGATLLPGREALITRIARYIHGSLSDEHTNYTRGVTWAWCLFFGSMALGSLLLFIFAPLSTWSLFANLLNLPMVAAMFLGEYAYRIVRYPDFSHASIRSMILAFSSVSRSALKSVRGR